MHPLLPHHDPAEHFTLLPVVSFSCFTIFGNDVISIQSTWKKVAAWVEYCFTFVFQMEASIGNGAIAPEC